MRKSIVWLSVVCVLLWGSAVYGGGRSAGVTFKPMTGDVSFDATLGNLNVAADGNLDGFLSNLSISYGVPRATLNDLVFKAEMSPADVYMTVGLARIADKPVDTVVREYQSNRGKGWGVIAKRLGIKPGSKAFHDLKAGSSVQLDKAKGKGGGKKHQGKGKGRKKK